MKTKKGKPQTLTLSFFPLAFPAAQATGDKSRMKIYRRFILAALMAACWSNALFAYNPSTEQSTWPRSKRPRRCTRRSAGRWPESDHLKTVADVEGLLLMKIRPERTDRDPQQTRCAGAAFGGSLWRSYITSFLGYEYRAIDKRGVVSSVPARLHQR